jgi:hypothetical protein
VSENNENTELFQPFTGNSHLKYSKVCFLLARKHIASQSDKKATMYNKITAYYSSDNQTKPINTLCGQQ